MPLVKQPEQQQLLADHALVTIKSDCVTIRLGYNL